jgi:hypothetical protein
MALVRRLIETSECSSVSRVCFRLCAVGGSVRMVLDEIADRLLLDKSNHIRGQKVLSLRILLVPRA